MVSRLTSRFRTARRIDLTAPPTALRHTLALDRPVRARSIASKALDTQLSYQSEYHSDSAGASDSQAQNIAHRRRRRRDARHAERHPEARLSNPARLERRSGALDVE